MRLPLIAPAEMDPSQRALYDDIMAGIGKRFTAFQTTDPATGALIGPWNAMLHEPASGAPMWALSRETAAASLLPAKVREVAILVVGAHFNAAYELYAHAAVGKSVGLTTEQIAMLCAGQRPHDLAPQEAVAFDAAHCLLNGGPLPAALYHELIAVLGRRETNQLFFLIGIYCSVSMLLNAHNVPAPELA
ncbi:carboxymuconolactone decarboxylase family protein [Sphingobium sp. BHU LFT2]|uniref:carboxymuconolactone decarboxylase family protein n=1 Tax=Sphingobium sp. BHU LFT2 TaxID=2807634 RepID=UPI001BEA202B|nr:carboxymuconolactone decarboxylase family protein [Sphingobium sp. BHU LFT2]MBT2246287.1 carboxymuconolactone decarboxylase family protein [Sphingobium sp. BHU LFT2]